MMTENRDMSLPLIRKKYLKQIICPNLLDGDCWNVCIENSILTFHFYWEDDDNEYMDCITIKLDNNMAIKGIEPIQAERMSYCDSRYADYAPCRATANHYMNLDHYMVKACVPIIDWDNLTDEQKLEKYQAVKDYLISWEKHNPLQNKEDSYIPTLEKRIKQLKGEAQ